MSGMQKKNLSQPDEARKFDKGLLELATLGGVTFGRATLQPGWKWSTSVKPLVNNWARELRMWADDLPFEVIGGDADSRRASWLVSNCPLKLVNYELLTRDAGRILTAFRELEVGGLIVGDTPSWRLDPMPYGGVKDSGLGREGIRSAIAEMTEPRMLVMAGVS